MDVEQCMHNSYQKSQMDSLLHISPSSYSLVGSPSPRLLITDKATSEVKGQMEDLIKELNVVINHTNLREPKKAEAKEARRERKKAQVNTPEGEAPLDFADKTLQELTPKERLLLLKDSENNTKPPLTILIQTHNSTS